MVQCTNNNYGVADKTYELRLSPCKDCPLNTQTTPSGACSSSSTTSYGTSTAGYWDPQACCTLPGYGFDGVQAAVCAPGKSSLRHSSCLCLTVQKRATVWYLLSLFLVTGHVLTPLWLIFNAFEDGSRTHMQLACLKLV